MNPAHGEDGHECEDGRQDCLAAARARGREAARRQSCERWKGLGCSCSRCQALDATQRRLGLAQATRTKCKGCGKDMVWGRADGGKNIPLDPRPAVYRVTGHDSFGTPEVARVQDEEIYVTHFATCPKASDFTRR